MTGTEVFRYPGKRGDLMAELRNARLDKTASRLVSDIATEQEVSADTVLQRALALLQYVQEEVNKKEARLLLRYPDGHEIEVTL